MQEDHKVFAIPNTKCGVVMKNGFQVADILFEGEYTSVQFQKMPLDDLKGSNNMVE